MHKMPKDLSEEDLQMINQFDKSFGRLLNKPLTVPLKALYRKEFH